METQMPERIWAWEDGFWVYKESTDWRCVANTEYTRADLCARWVPVEEWLANNESRAVQTVIARLKDYDPYRGAAYHDGIRWRTLDDDEGDDEVLYVLDNVPEPPQ